MSTKLKIGSKITALVLAVVLVSVLSVSYLAFTLSKQSIRERHQESINSIADARTQQIKSFFEQLNTSIAIVKHSADFQKEAAVLLTDSAKSETEVSEDLEESLKLVADVYGLSNIYFADATGQVVYRMRSADNPALAPILKDIVSKLGQAKDTTIYSPIFSQEGQVHALAVSPLSENSANGVLIYELNVSPLLHTIQDTIGLGATGEVILAQSLNGRRNYFGSRRQSIAIRDAVKPASQSAELTMGTALKTSQNWGLITDYRNVQTIAAWREIPMVKWEILVKIDADEVYQPALALRNTFIIVGFVVLLLSFIISVIFSHLLTSPLLSLKNTMAMLGKGVLPNQVHVKSNDEIGEMTDTVNSLVEGLKKTANFAHKIGEGNFDADFKPMSGNDTLGLALLSMRDNIQDSAKRDEERNWIVTGIAEVGDILRSTDNLEDLGDQIVAYVTRKINAVQGAFYVVNDDDVDNTFLELTASYAYNKKKYLQAKFRFAEGLVGQAAIEQDTILRTEVPDKYVTITSGLLGDRKPKCLLIVPLITVIGSERVVYGALELAGFEKFSSRNVQFVKEISEIIARTVFNIKVNGTTRKLLQMSQKQSEELQMQQEVLRQNAEEMEATQEELKRSNGALEDQVQEVNRTQKRMQVLLENASEVITIYEKDGRIRYISPSVERILGYSQQELIGIKDVIYVHPLGVEDYERMFRDLLEHPEQQVTIQFSYKVKNSDRIWLEATGTNLLSDPAIAGIVLNTRDITERRRAEKETRMRGQMQALSENSPDLITRLNKEGKIFYINPVIETYTGLNKDEYLLKAIEEVVLDGTIIESWNTILNDVITNDHQVSTEMNFPSVKGNCIMQVNAIPEYNENRYVESVLVVSHDITDRKLIELEIQTKNKKITESINYAKRIQEAILPDTNIIRQAFHQSFILYKPRDVVSGDFPWFMQKGDDVYIAAVDCTGHGVPGALISLIGYFLLNNIVNNRDVSDPGHILDQLDQGVTKTLKQDSSDNATRDGMDIALCKINRKKKTLEFAGAHRPLYYVSNGELIEIKGDKFPIGGAQYKTRTNFTTTKLEIAPGDSAFFCSDGFPDQFGGPENRKFSPQRIRNIILENLGDDISVVNQAFDDQFEEWKGENKQTDDVLMIGIKF